MAVTLGWGRQRYPIHQNYSSFLWFGNRVTRQNTVIACVWLYIYHLAMLVVVTHVSRAVRAMLCCVLID